MTKQIGEGAYGKVRLSFKQGKGTLILNKYHQQQIINEILEMYYKIQLMKAVKHPFIIRLEDVIDNNDCPEKIYLDLELADWGDFFDYVSSRKRLPEQLAKFYFYQLALAIQYLHNRGITHRDIKLENISLETNAEESHLKLTDFDMSKLAADITKMTTMCGTKTYMAPELLMISSTNTYNKKVDLWCIGVNFLWV
ncbi:unnamed protein product [Meganyctiphanes norvegica]|uniref:Protein kinase domain-containing protein n=1 Tax=Meganyctiphanes norvegica TaxID=48144 RepID=A0AAV2R058_MEGNR